MTVAKGQVKRNGRCRYTNAVSISIVSELRSRSSARCQVALGIHTVYRLFAGLARDDTR